MACPHAPDLFGAHEAARFQHLQMLEHRGQRHLKRLGQLLDGGRPAAEAVYHAAPGRIGQRLEHQIEWF
jgi:hypothetical protein